MSLKVIVPEGVIKDLGLSRVPKPGGRDRFRKKRNSQELVAYKVKDLERKGGRSKT